MNCPGCNADNEIGHLNRCWNCGEDISTPEKRRGTVKNMKSTTLPNYTNWLSNATPDQITKVDEIYLACEQHYQQGGDAVVECMGPEEVLKHLGSVEDARRYCNLGTENAQNARWGEDSDPELKIKTWEKN